MVVHCSYPPKKEIICNRQLLPQPTSYNIVHAYHLDDKSQVCDKNLYVLNCSNITWLQFIVPKRFFTTLFGVHFTSYGIDKTLVIR